MNKGFIIISIVLIGLSSCGNDNSTAESTPPTSKETKETKETKEPNKDIESKEVESTETIATGETVELKLESNDQMQFNLKELRVPAGSKVKLTLIHTGTMAKELMGHNFVLLNSGVELGAFANAAVEAGPENNYLPKGNDVIAHTTLIGGGESTTVAFDAPPSGVYDFICSFPGHYGLMQGKFYVE